MMGVLCSKYRDTRFMFVGFSMGGNIVTRYLSEIDEELQKRILLGISVCQGYNIKS